MLYDLSMLKILSIEVGNDCNLKHIHTKCPINHIPRPEGSPLLSVADIIRIIDSAVKLNFKGYVAFHHYNEPLLYIKEIEEVIRSRPKQRYLLWSNGLLIPKVEKMGFSLKMFDKIILTCYDEKQYDFYLDIQNRYNDVEIGIAQMDDRLTGYDEEYENLIACKKVFFELPVNCHGEVLLCAHDWKNSCKLGNVFHSSFEDIVTSERYQNILSMYRKRKIQEQAPDICKRCRYAYLTYHAGDDILENSAK